MQCGRAAIMQELILCREAQITVCSRESHFISSHSFQPNENLHFRTRYAEMLSLFSVTPDICWRAEVLTSIRAMLKKWADFVIICQCFLSQHRLCPTLFFPKLPMEITHDQEICQAKLNNKKLFCYTIVSALGSLFFF